MVDVTIRHEIRSTHASMPVPIGNVYHQHTYKTKPTDVRAKIVHEWQLKYITSNRYKQNKGGYSDWSGQTSWLYAFDVTTRNTTGSDRECNISDL